MWGNQHPNRLVSVGFQGDGYCLMPVSLSYAVQQDSIKSLPLRFAGNTKAGGAAYNNSAGGPTELCRPPGMLDLHKPNTLIEANTEVSIREHTKQDRSTYQLWVESCREV